MTMWLRKQRIKFLRWLNGEGFTMPKPDPIDHCMYNYCQDIVNHRAISKIESYEEILANGLKNFPELTREDAAKSYIEALEWVYGKENI